MPTKKVTYLLIGLMLACSTAMAQFSAPFSFVPIASSNGTTVMSGGNPIILDGSGKCLNVTSGLSALNINNNGKGVFGASCVENAPAAAVVTLTSLNLFPNPTRAITVLKCEGQFDANLSAMVRVISIDGKMMMSKMVPMKEIAAGYQIDASAWAAGNYVVTLDFMSEHHSRKLIKL